MKNIDFRFINQGKFVNQFEIPGSPDSEEKNVVYVAKVNNSSNDSDLDIL